MQVCLRRALCGDPAPVFSVFLHVRGLSEQTEMWGWLSLKMHDSRDEIVLESVLWKCMKII